MSAICRAAGRVSSAAILRNLKRRLERMELEHLREHALELHQRLEQATEQLQRAQDECHNADIRAEFWQGQVTEIQDSLSSESGADHRAIGLTKTGELLVVRLDA